MNYMTYISNFLPQTSLFGTANFAANDTVIIAGVTFTFKATPALWNDIAVGADIPTSLANANLVLSGKGAIQPTASADIKSLAKVVATGAFFKQDSATTPNTVLVNSGDVTIGGSDFVAGSRTIYGLAERTGSIDIVIQRQATPQINKAPKQLGYNTLLVNLYGVKAFQDGRDRMVMLPFPRV
jgi:hypothetical protein